MYKYCLEITESHKELNLLVFLLYIFFAVPYNWDHPYVNNADE